MNNLIKLIDIPGEDIILKLKFLSKTNISVTINMGDYIKFCFDAKDFIAPIESELLNSGCYGLINDMKIFVSKAVDEGFVILEGKSFN